MTDRNAAEIAHEIIEAAKASYRDDQDLPFVRHLEIQARAIAGAGWTWDVHPTASGGWSIELTTIGTNLIEPDQPRGLL
jgi:hypothetical protein